MHGEDLTPVFCEHILDTIERCIVTNVIYFVKICIENSWRNYDVSKR